MLSLSIRALLIVGLLLGVTHSGEAAEITWYNDVAKASAIAQQRGLPMFIDFWADWCAACKVMDDDVYTEAGVIRAFEEKIIGVRVHFDLQPDVARRYNVPALPFLLFTNSYGTPLIYHRGFLEAEDLTKVIQAIPALDAINRLDRALQRDKDDFASLLAMSRILREQGFYEASNNFYDRASRHKAARNDAGVRESILFDVASNAIEIMDGRKAAEAMERSLKDFPKSARRADMLLVLGRAYILDEKPARARKAFDTVINEFPQTPMAAEAATLRKSL